MIPIPSKEDMEELALEARLQYYDNDAFKIQENYRVISKPIERDDCIVIDVEDSFDESITGQHTGII